MIDLIKKNRYSIALLGVLLAGLFVRFNNFQSWQGFDYDQEINAFIAKTILIDRKPVLIGPETSVGGMFVGSFFNYFIALFFWLGKMDPTATVFANVVISAATIVSIYFVGSKLFSPNIGFISSVLYSFSAFLATYDRVLWNPTPIPLVSLWIFYFLLKFISERNRWFLAGASLLVGLMFHLHFQAFLLLGFLLTGLLLRGRHLINWKNLLIILLCLSPFILPLVVFDLRHQFINSNHLIAFAFKSHDQASANLLDGLWRSMNVFLELNGLIFSSTKDVLPLALTCVIIFNLFKKNLKKLNPSEKLFHRLCLLLFSICIFGLGLYKGPMPIYYLLFVFPIFILVTSVFLAQLFQNNQISWILMAVSLGIFLMVNLPKIASEKNTLSLLNKKSAVDFIVSDAQGRPFTVDNITHPGLNTGYKYLFWQAQRNRRSELGKQKPIRYKIVVPKTIALPSEIVASFGVVGIVKE